MTALCQNLEPFVDGELDSAAAAAFRDHLLTCGKCQAGLGELLQLGMLADRYHQRTAPPEIATEATAGAKIAARRREQEAAARGRFRPMRAMRRVLAGSMSLAIVAALVFAGIGWTDALWLPGKTGRLIEGRSSYSSASGYHPQKDQKMGPGEELAPPPLALLALLPRRGLAAAYLVRGQPARAEDALQVLEPLEDSPDVLSERALAHLVRADAGQGDYEEALRLTDAALEKDPRHGPALFNKALALHELGLDLLAASTFGAVAALGEPGWSQEARLKAEQLRGLAMRSQKRWDAALEAGAALFTSGTEPPPALLDVPILRLYFYDAVRSRISAAGVQALLPLARELDHRAGGTVLEDYVQAVARRDFTVRKPHAERYHQFITRRGAAADDQLVDDLLHSTEEDILVGTLVRLQAGSDGARELPAFPRRVLTAADPWFDVLQLQYEAREAKRRNDLRTARQKLKEALGSCRQPGLEFRCLDVELALTDVLLRSSEYEDAYAHAVEGWRIAQRVNEWGKQTQLIQELAQLARLRSDFPLVRVYLEEAIERTRQDQNRAHELFARETLALTDISLLRLDDAREQIDAAIATRLPLGMGGALALADIARLRPESGDAAAMEAFRTQIPGMNPGERALATHALGRFTIEIRPEEGRQLLEDAIAQAKRLEPGGDAGPRALTYSYTSLILAAGKERDFAAAWTRFEEEVGAALPARCMVAAVADVERTLVVTRSASGAVDGSYDVTRTAPITERVAGLVPSRLLAGLRDCAEVQVLAGAPLYGRAELLPRDIAWSYMLPRAPPEHDSSLGRDGTGTHLIVQDVALAERRRGLGTIRSWELAGTGDNDVILSGAAATPAAVLQYIENASEIDIVAHGLVDPFSDEAYLVLAQDGDSDTLRASQIEEKVLRHRPLVVLASCSAAHPGPQLAAPRSLPAAFLRAGAQAVLAAASEIPQQEGRDFFSAVRRRIQAGNTAARALRDERESWIKHERGQAWLDSVLLFE